MSRVRRPASRLCGVLLVLGIPAAGLAQNLTGLWDASVVVNNLTIPFRFQIAQQGTSVKGSFFNGDEKIASRSGQFKDGKLVLLYPDYGATLNATLTNGRLDGQYVRATRAPYPFQAKRFAPSPIGVKDVPNIAGLWNIQLTKSKDEAAWYLIVRQSGAEISAAILRVDGDSGMLTGAYHDHTFVLSHFDGARPSLVELTPTNGGLQVVEDGGEPLVAVRSAEARAKGLLEPSDPTRFTSVKDPGEPFTFSFPDLQGRIVSNTDARFRRKVVIVSIGGSWCPNCHDEAPFLTELYRTYHPRGLEIVLLSFEEGDQLRSLTRLRAFIKRYAIQYTVLVPGAPSQLTEKIPQGANLYSFPTTFFLGRDVLVRGVHAGFAGKATGSFYTELRRETIARIEGLLAERLPSSTR
jgi:thiol-disulfide isomerase/thioredoxin